MNDARQNRQPSDGRLFWGIFTLAALVWAVTVFAVSMSRRTPVPQHAGSETPPPANGHRFKSIETAESQAERKRYRHEEYYPQTGKRKSSEEVYYDDRWSPIRHGQMTAWYENGQRQVEGHWSDGRRVGQWQAWHENGQPWVQGEYDNNEQAQGTWQYYDPQGRPCGQRSSRASRSANGRMESPG